jgi:hypothetical protein
MMRVRLYVAVCIMAPLPCLVVFSLVT